MVSSLKERSRAARRAGELDRGCVCPWPWPWCVCERGIVVPERTKVAAMLSCDLLSTFSFCLGVFLTDSATDTNSDSDKQRQARETQTDGKTDRQTATTAKRAGYIMGRQTGTRWDRKVCRALEVRSSLPGWSWGSPQDNPGKTGSTMSSAQSWRSRCGIESRHALEQPDAIMRPARIKWIRWYLRSPKLLINERQPLRSRDKIAMTLREPFPFLLFFSHFKLDREAGSVERKRQVTSVIAFRRSKRMPSVLFS